MKTYKMQLSIASKAAMSGLLLLGLAFTPTHAEELEDVAKHYRDVAQGSNGSDGKTYEHIGGTGGDGSSPDALYYPSDLRSAKSERFYNASGSVFWMERIGGNGGNGGTGYTTVDVWNKGYGGNGGTGGVGGDITFNNLVSMTTIAPSGAYADNAAAIYVMSLGGNGGNGGTGEGATGEGGDGGAGGNGGEVFINTSALLNTGDITTAGKNSHGIFAQSLGGNGGGGGSGEGITGSGGGGSGSGGGGTVTVINGGNFNGGTIKTGGAVSHGILAQSIGGFSGKGGSGSGIVGYGGNSSNSGDGGEVTVTNSGAMNISGSDSHAIFAQSIGGGGGSAGRDSGLVALGASGSAGGSGNSVTVTNSGALQLSGAASRGIFAQSIGGGGGNGSSSDVLVAIGGSGGSVSNGGAVSVTNSGTISSQSNAIFAQSIGGGGGSGGTAKGWISLGGGGSGGGDGGSVDINHTGTLSTSEANASAVFAQSLGGGGGNGGSSTSGGITGSVAIGGGGGHGGNGAQVQVSTTSAGGSITTTGDSSHGILAQSTGGGGGNGNYAKAASGGAFSASVAIGGHGGGGGNGGHVETNILSNIITSGSFADGILAQSVGGGGGHGGFAVTGALSQSLSASLGLGGSGGSGGNAGTVSASAGSSSIIPAITTNSDHSHGILAQSIGGGGGKGGFSVAASGGGISASMALGGTGGNGGDGSLVTMTNSGVVTTKGDNSHALFAQSVGGGGGSGNFSVSGSFSGGAVSVGIGGKGGKGGNADNVVLVTNGSAINSNDISTSGNNSIGVFAQSIGGGGGNGGFSVAGGISAVGSTGVSLGGSGGTGGSGGSVTLTSSSIINTNGNLSHGVLAQSVGGGGGNGGFSVSGTLSVGLPDGSSGVGVAVSLGGNGGKGNHAGAVKVTSSGNIETAGNSSAAIMAQSVGGGGGNGGYSGALAFAKSGAVAVSLGGNGGNGDTGDTVTLNSNTNITTRGNDSQGILAQSIGGGGGNGAFSAALSIAASNPILSNLTLTLGGNGGTGGNAKDVTVDTTVVGTTTVASSITTSGDRSAGILAQSVGGGGGNGGISLSLAGGTGAYSFADVPTLNLGSKAGGGGNAGVVQLNDSSNVTTSGNFAAGILAQSIGGGGGTGGTRINGDLSINETGMGLSLGASGVNGSGGGDSGAVTVSETLAPGSTGKVIKTQGFNSSGIFAQSVGGGGGNGGYSLSEGFKITTKPGYVPAMALAFGGKGGAGGLSGDVKIDSCSTISTEGDNSPGIFAQSIGGGGGNGGVAYAISGSNQSSKSGGVSTLSLAMGGSGGSGNKGGNVTVTTNNAQIATGGNSATGILAQSIGGGGGNGGGSVGIAVSAGASSGSSWSGAIGGTGGSGGVGGNVNVTSQGGIQTGRLTDTGDLASGNDSKGILAQSIGGGGGNGGFSVSAAMSAGGKGSIGGVSFALGGSGGKGNTAGAVTVASTGTFITTLGDRSNGIFAHSVGGGGGNGGFSIAADASSASQLALSIGGNGGSGGNAGTVTVTNSSDINVGFRKTGTEQAVVVQSNDATAILSQSIGGGGGSGGFSIAGTVGMKDGVAPTLSFGGTGAGGGNGEAVEVNNSGAIVTRGERSGGILAQSIGGGGGNGGFSIAGSLSSSAALGLSMGGSGGFGGTSGNVTVTNSTNAGIDTVGNDASGIQAQSIAGGGGSGGFGIAGGVSLQNAGLGIGIGGKGGTGNTSGVVTVTDTGLIGTNRLIKTNGDRSAGILAQSIGGGGGSGGFSVSVGFGLTGALGLYFGGTSESSADSGQVTVDSNSSFATAGYDSPGIIAQSIGGGGGFGGVNVKGEVRGAKHLDVTVGGKANIGGNGSDVSITATGAGIITAGNRSSGIIAQSIGGGGGISWISADGAVQTVMAGLTVGGQGGSSGAGGSVTISNSAAITLNGAGSYGILAQSIGGGGGVGSNDALKSPGTVMGGTGSSNGKYTSGNGGQVNITNSGTIISGAKAGFGIIAQSIGGGGGLASYTGTGNINAIKADGMPQGDGNNSGDGGSVSVNNYGAITTTRTGAVGILAQSIGGGGGLDVYSGSTGSAGGTGNGGAITVTNLGSITTSGDSAHGIFAQSVGGRGSGGGVNIKVNGIVVATGAGANGILAESTGSKGNGHINVNITHGAMVQVQGGTGGAAVAIIGGDAGVTADTLPSTIVAGINNLDNYGTITTSSGASGTAISNSGGGVLINNYGAVTGSIDLSRKAGNGHINNYGTLNAGDTVNLSAGNRLINHGTFSPGGTSKIATTTITGNFSQLSSGTIQIDLDNKAGTRDLVHINGDAELGGVVSLTHLNTKYTPGDGSNPVTIISVSGAVTDNGMALKDGSVIRNYQLAPSSGNSDVVISKQLSANAASGASVYALTYTSDFNPAGLTKNQQILGAYLQALHTTGAASSVGSLLGYYEGLPDIQSLGAAYDSLMPYSHEANTLTTTMVNRQYTRNTQNRMKWLRFAADKAGSGAITDATAKPVMLAYNGSDLSPEIFQTTSGISPKQKKLDVWLEGFSQTARSETQGFSKFKSVMAGGSGGIDYTFTDNFVAGAGFGYANTSVDIDGSWKQGNVESYYGSLYATYFTDTVYLEGVFSYGQHKYQNNHLIDTGNKLIGISSSHGGTSFTTVMEGGYTFRPNELILQPFAALSHDYLTEDGFQEKETEGIGFTIASNQTNFLCSEAGLRLAKPFNIGYGRLVPQINAAWKYDFQIDKLETKAVFTTAPSDGFTMEGRDAGLHRAILGGEIAFIETGAFSASLRYEADLGDNYTSHAFSGQLRMSF